MKQPLTFFKSLAEEISGDDSIQTIEEVFIDSRKQVDNGLFVPIRGERFDGHDFLLPAIEKGAVASFWEKDHPLPEDVPETFPIYYVENTVDVLQKAAEKYLKLVKPHVVAITGSNGKTTTKDILAEICKQQYRTHKTVGNYNNHIGLPLSVLSMDEDCELLILEMGMSGFGEISLLSELTGPDFAIITNIGESHLEQLGSRKGIAKAKLEIGSGLKRGGSLIIDGDEPLLTETKDKRIIACGYHRKADVQIGRVSGNEDGQFFSLNGESTSFYLPLLGKHNIKNACFAIVVARRLNISDLSIQNGLKLVRPTAMRLERLRGKNDSLLINDAYNASPASMKAAIDTLQVLTAYPKKVAVLGDMYELGENEKKMHQDVAEYIQTQVDQVITIGQKGKWIGDALLAKRWPGKVTICASKEEALAVIEPILTPSTVVLFKASRGLALETLVRKLICQ